VRREGARPPARPRPLDPIALEPRREDGVRQDLEPVDSGRTLRLDLDLEA
jgi:hypothetical protein